MRTLLLTAALGAAVGCSRDKNADQPKPPSSTAQLKGKVSYQGKTVPAGYIHVMAEDSREEASARIQKDGTYAAAAPVGRVRVTVETAMVRDEYDDPAERKKWYVPIPSRYAGFTDTPIRTTVAGDQTLDLELTDQ